MSVVVNPSPAMTFVELDGTAQYSILVINTWEDWDLTALIPANALAVLVNTAAGNNAYGVRPNNSAQARIVGGYGYSMVSRHANRIIECYSSALGGAGGLFYLLGYWV